MPFNNISIIGLGYIGLPTAAVLASKQLNVVGVDINQDVVNTINKGKIHITEARLQDIVTRVVKSGHLRANTKPVPSDVFLIAVPTPFDFNKNTADLSYIKEAITELSKVIKKGDLIILESTSPVGTTEKAAEWLSELCPELSFPQTNGEEADIKMAYCPERILPGNALVELQKNNRLIGGLSKSCSLMAKAFYEIFVTGQCLVTNARTAEMAKLTENTFRDINIAFANELSMICDDWGISVWELINLANNHPRVNILEPGPGVGGHCIAVDPWFIVSQASGKAILTEAARLVNNKKPDWVVSKINDTISDYLYLNKNKSLNEISISIYGLAYKPNVDDLRESPSIEIINRLGKFYDGVLNIVEPNIGALPSSILNKNVKLVEMEEAASSDIHVLLVRHSQFNNINAKLGPNSVLINVKGD